MTPKNSNILTVTLTVEHVSMEFGKRGFSTARAISCASRLRKSTGFRRCGGYGVNLSSSYRVCDVGDLWRCHSKHSSNFKISRVLTGYQRHVSHDSESKKGCFTKEIWNSRKVFYDQYIGVFCDPSSFYMSVCLWK